MFSKVQGEKKHVIVLQGLLCWKPRLMGIMPDVKTVVWITHALTRLQLKSIAMCINKTS